MLIIEVVDLLILSSKLGIPAAVVSPPQSTPLTQDAVCETQLSYFFL